MKESLHITNKMRSPSVHVNSPYAPRSGRSPQRSPSTQRSVEYDDEDEGPSDTCQFCGLYDPNFTDDTLDYHFWQDCPMLSDCEACGQVIEIPCYNEHLLTECEKRDRFQACQRCDEPQPKETLPAHEAAGTCLVAKPSDKYNRCPLCHADFPPGEDGWREHLLVPPGCPANKRKIPNTLIEQMGAGQ